MNIILSHDHTDFDAVASQLGAWKVYPGWVPVIGPRLNRNVRNFLTLHWGALPFVQDEDLPRKTTIERIMLVDTQRVPTIRGINTRKVPDVWIIDHHKLRDNLPEHWVVELDQVGSCTTLFVEAIMEQRLPLSWVEATLLLLGIHEDTGSLVFNLTTVRDGRAAVWLMEQGAHLDTVREFLEHPLTAQQRALYHRLLGNVETLDIHGLQIIVAQAEAEGYVKGVSILAHNLREVYDPSALILAISMGGYVQLVARSTSMDVDVGQLMRHFGGGGHARAAAASVDDEPLAQVVERLKTRLQEDVHPRIIVKNWMSRGDIRSFTPKTRVKEAAELMQRWGHEGFPVVDDQQRVVGLLTRRDVDRAIQHKLHNARITQFMHKGELAVTPNDSLEHVQQVMTNAKIGQVPVIDPDSQKMIGIITRTDLLNRVAQVLPERRAQTLMQKVAANLSPVTFALVRTMAREADELSYQAYLVGGIVRDLLLGSPMKDLDIVIEGNAIQLAKRLVKTLGGRLVAHERFGTGKWILDPKAIFSSLLPSLELSSELLEANKDQLPAHIDLITARTEFYERPTALPHVVHASIKQDLHRRDFTINTLALSLDPDHEGQLLDFYGGEKDLEQGIIRILHNLSFVDDPTRIMRAIRFEQRFSFQLDPRTEELLLDSLDLLEIVSPDRLRHELYLILQEKMAAQMLARLDELGIMPYLLPNVSWNTDIYTQFKKLQKAGHNEPESLLAALIWSPTATPEHVQQITTHLALPNLWRARYQMMVQLTTEESYLTTAPLPNSHLYRHLHPYDPIALELLATLTPNPTLHQHIRLYLDDLRHRPRAIDGQDIRATGLPPGPIYKTILDKIHAAMLDGEAPDEASQRALLALMTRQS